MSPSSAASRTEVREIVQRFEACPTPAEKQHVARELEQCGNEGVRDLVSIIHLGDWDELGGCMSTVVSFVIALLFFGIAIIYLASVGPNPAELVCAFVGALFLAIAL